MSGPSVEAAATGPSQRVRPLRVLIVDDEPVARRGLRLFLQTRPEVDVVGECQNGAEAVSFFRRHPVDLVLLDIQMPLLDGFAVLRTIGIDAMPAVIFITAFDEFAVRAFDVAAVDYVVKPYSDDRLAHAMDRATSRLRERRVTEAHERLLEALGENASVQSSPLAARTTTQAGYASRLLVSVGARGVVVPLGDVTLIQADGYHVRVWTAETRYTLRESLQDLEQRLDPAEFLRVHRSVIIRIQTVKSVERSREDRMFLLLAGGRRVPVSRSRRDAVIHALGSIRG